MIIFSNPILSWNLREAFRCEIIIENRGILWHPIITLSPCENSDLLWFRYIYSLVLFIWLIIFFVEVSSCKWKIRTYEKTWDAWHSYSNTEEHVVNAVIAVNNDMIKKRNSATLHIPWSILINKCLKRHTKFLCRSTNHAHDEEQ